MSNVFPIFIIWTSPFSILGLLDGIFYFYSKFNRIKNSLQANSGNPVQTPSSVASGLGLHYLPTGNKMDSRHMYVKSKIILVNLSISPSFKLVYVLIS